MSSRGSSHHISSRGQRPSASHRPSVAPASSHSRSSSGSSGRLSAGSTHPPALRPAPATYTDDELDYLEEENEERVTQQHLLYALDHVVRVLDSQRISYGVMGGMSMILLGNQGRTTRDVDVAVEARVRDLLAAFSTDRRVYIPRAIAVSGSGVARIFVLTGTPYGQPVAPLAVEVDLILNGNKGAPRTLEGTTDTHRVQTGVGTRSWDILKLKYLFRAKLRSFYEREGTNDYRDLTWMCFSHHQTVSGFAAGTDERLREFFASRYAENEPNPDRVGWLRSLLGLRPSSSSSSHSSGRSNNSSSRAPQRTRR